MKNDRRDKPDEKEEEEEEDNVDKTGVERVKRMAKLLSRPDLWIWAYFLHRHVPNAELQILTLRSCLEVLDNGMDQSLMRSMIPFDCASNWLEERVHGWCLMNRGWAMAEERRKEMNVDEGGEEETLVLTWDVNGFELRTSRMKPVKRGDDELVMIASVHNYQGKATSVLYRLLCSRLVSSSSSVDVRRSCCN